MLRAVIVDIDNTLYPYGPSHEAGLRSAAEFARSVAPAWSSYSQFIDDYRAARSLVQNRVKGQACSHSRLLYFKEMLDAAGRGSDLIAVTDLDRAYWVGYHGVMVLDTRCAETLSDWRKSGLKVLLLSNFQLSGQIQKLERLGMREFDHLICSEELGFEKPDARAFQAACFRLKVSPAECVMVGDSWEDDIVPSKALGMTAVWLCRDEKPSVAPKEILVCSNWKEIERVSKSFLADPVKNSATK